MEPPKVELSETFVELCQRAGIDPDTVEEILSEPIEDGGIWIVRINDVAVGVTNLDEKRYARIMENKVERYASYGEALDADLPQLTTSMEPGKKYKLVAYDESGKPQYQMPVGNATQAGALGRCLVVRVAEEDLNEEFVRDLRTEVNRGRKEHLPVIAVSGDVEFIQLVEET